MSIPPPDPATPTDVESHRVPSTDDVTLAVHDLGGEGVPVLLCHPTGFHGLVWRPVAAELAREAHVWSLDFRGHGDSALPASGSFQWSGMADDVLAVIDAQGLHGEPLVGAGHSMGGAALMLAEQTRPGLFAALWCFEPIVMPAAIGPGPPSEFPLAVAARRRKARFPDRQTALVNYAAKPPLSRLRPDALEAYVSHGFRDLPGGGVELKCAPETEALCFEASVEADTFAHLGEVKCPVTVVASGDDGFPAQLAPEVAEALPNGHLERQGDLTHFGPMEDPPLIARSILRSVNG